MPEHAHEERQGPTGGLRTPPVKEWDSWPFEGDVQPKALRAPEPEPPRDGEGGRPCESCGKADAEYFWTDERWRLLAFPPSGLPVVAILEPREHADGPRDLSDAMRAEMGIMLARVERAVLSIEGIERVHILRYGEVRRTCTGGSWDGRAACARPPAASRCSGTTCSRRRPMTSGARTSRPSPRR
jgi:hypothetical protein